MPYAPPPPKSGCNFVSPPVALIEWINRAESERTGSFETSLFQALLAGNTWHPPTRGGDGAAFACTDAPALGRLHAATITAANAPMTKLRLAAIPLHRPDAPPTLNSGALPAATA